MVKGKNHYILSSTRKVTQGACWMNTGGYTTCPNSASVIYHYIPMSTCPDATRGYVMCPNSASVIYHYFPMSTCPDDTRGFVMCLILPALLIMLS